MTRLTQQKLCLKAPRALQALTLLVTILCCPLSAGGAFAQSPGEAPSDPALAGMGTTSASSSNAMTSLVRLLVAQGIITKAKGDELIAQALQDAAQTNSGSPSGAQAGENLPPAPSGTIRVPYVPETVRDQIRDELKADVMKEAREEGWASPDKAAPDWTRGIRLYGDMRLRAQSQFYGSGNSPQVPNYQAIVASGPLDLLGGAIPFLNTTKDKYDLFRIRARLGVDVNVNSKVKVGIELASGDNPYPVSSNTNTGNGFFNRNLYIHKAFVEAQPLGWLKTTAGRMANPFLSTDALFAPDLSFDGLSTEISVPRKYFKPGDVKLRVGAFPLDFGDQNFPDTSETKVNSHQKWLFSGQIEGDYHLHHNSVLKLAVGYHHFMNVQGRLSSPCPLGIDVTQCSSDGLTPFFVQKGNTYFQMRNIINASGQSIDGPQLLGLTQPFHVLDVMEVLKIPVNDRIDFTFTGDYVRNLGFRKRDACRYGEAGEPVNNGGSGGSGNTCDPDLASRTRYEGGKQGFQLIASLGYPAPHQWGEWKVYGAYKYLQSDAVLDAFTDPDFHLGGTNAKGYIIGGNFGLYQGVTAGARWLSANQITADPLAIDVLQLDLNVAF